MISEFNYFHVKRVRLEFCIGLKVMISFFREVKECRSVMNVKLGGAAVHHMETNRGCVAIAPLIRTLDYLWRWVVSIT
jgi:hypothetical protein